MQNKATVMENIRINKKKIKKKNVNLKDKHFSGFN